MNLTRGQNRQRDDGNVAPLARFRGEIENLFDRFVRDPWGSITGQGRERWMAPRLDVAEDDDEITLRVELPGVKPEDIQVDVTGDVLTLRGEKCARQDEKARDFQYCETEYGSFSRTVQLPVRVDPERVDAAYRDGVLTITLTKRPDAKPRRIAVRGGESEGAAPRSDGPRPTDPGGPDTRGHGEVTP